MQPSYAQDLGTSQITHGVYGTFISGLGVLVGFCGAIPVCPVSREASRQANVEPDAGRQFPNPFKNVQQGSVGLVSRFGQFYKVRLARHPAIPLAGSLMLAPPTASRSTPASCTSTSAPRASASWTSRSR